MNDETKRQLCADPEGLRTYEYIANNVESLTADDLDFLVDNMARVDLTGQYVVSAARYLHAIDAERFAQAVGELAEAAIDRDREHRYLMDLLLGLYGPVYAEKASELEQTDRTFRRIYRRLYPTAGL